MTKLYHSDIGFPKGIKMPSGTRTLKYTRHALSAAQSDRYGNIDKLPNKINMSVYKPFEVKVDDGKVTKVGYRVTYNDNFDLILIINPLNNKVITLWLNSKRDKHSTLQKGRYDIPEGLLGPAVKAFLG